MKNLKFTMKEIRWLAFLLLCSCLISCGGPAEQAPETTAPKKAYPSVGVGRPEHIEPPPDTGITICIDPGHGFDDVGCSSEYLTDGKEEKDMTLLYANELKTELEGLGYTVLLTHDGKTFPQEFNTNQNNLFSPDERSAYVNTLDIDFLLSLHCDTFDEDTSVGGSRVYYYDTEIKQNASSDGICNSISTWLAKEFPDMRTPPVHNNQSYIILRKSTMAAALVEIGFISNKNDAMNLQDSVWMDKFINGVVQGIHNYYSNTQ